MARSTPKKPARRKPRRNGVDLRVFKLERAVAGLDVRVGGLEEAIRKLPDTIEREGIIVADKLLVAMSKRLEMHEHRIDRLVESRIAAAQGQFNLAIEEIRGVRGDMNDNARALLERYWETVEQLQCPQAGCPLRAREKP